MEQDVSHGCHTSVMTRTGTQWRPSIMRRDGDYAMVLEGCEPGCPVDMTDYRDPTVSGLVPVIACVTKSEDRQPTLP